MSELKATPGPWLVATSCSWRRIVNDRGDLVCVPTIQHSDNHPDLEFPNGGPEGPDASLMIASRDMYEALLDAKEWLEGWASAKPQLAVIDAALAKARGES